MHCDLHTHSTASDGMTTPTALADLAAKTGLGAVALTDHDTTEGLPACAARCEQVNVRFVPGIEISADPDLHRDGPSKGDDSPPWGTLHILGLFVRHDAPALLHIRERMRRARNERNPAIVDRLRDLGIDITYAQVEALAAAQGTQVIGRPHIGEVLVVGGHAASMADAFQRYLGQRGAAYVRRDRLAARDAIDGIHHAGGLAVLAHPVQLGVKDPVRLEAFVRQLVDLGMDGLETRHSDHDPTVVRELETMAQRLGLLTSGGSDFHGSRKPVALGAQGVSMAVYQRLLEHWQQLHGP